MTGIFILLAVIGAIALLSMLLPSIARSIPAFIGLIVLAVMIGGVIFFITI